MGASLLYYDRPPKYLGLFFISGFFGLVRVRNDAEWIGEDFSPGSHGRVL